MDNRVILPSLARHRQHHRPVSRIACRHFRRSCEAYEHIGQHGGANYWGVIQQTVPVELHEAEDLAEELEMIGYNLRPIRRASWHHHEKRRQAARECALA